MTPSKNVSLIKLLIKFKKNIEMSNIITTKTEYSLYLIAVLMGYLHIMMISSYISFYIQIHIIRYLLNILHFRFFTNCFNF